MDWSLHFHQAVLIKIVIMKQLILIILSTIFSISLTAQALPMMFTNKQQIINLDNNKVIEVKHHNLEFKINQATKTIYIVDKTVDITKSYSFLKLEFHDYHPCYRLTNTKHLITTDSDTMLIDYSNQTKTIYYLE